MNSSTPNPDLPSAASETGASYSLDILSEMTGLTTETILHYQAHGLVHPMPGSGPKFGDETVRALRRIEYLRETCDVNLAGLKLLNDLLDQVERLRAELRSRR
jgi:DNA-binding transcriptional MerR regulator